MFLVVGLGNPGSKYAMTRHNVGFDIVNEFASRHLISWNGRVKNGALVADGRLGDQKVILALPQQYMNRSGQPVASLQGYYKLSASQIIVVHDEMSLDFGTIRLKQKGGHGGHNGLRDIIQHVGNQFLRVRVGIGRPPSGWDPANFVLGKWSSSEKDELESLIDSSVFAIERIIQSDVQVAMREFNTRN
jgi:PTH1 family peptidyl-tRNA hydrolase